VNFQQLLNSSVFTFPSHAVSAEYGSLVRSAEINAKHKSSDWLSLLIGFRYINLQESLTIRQDVYFSHTVDTTNNLFGGQVGMDAFLWSRGRARLDGWAKGGLYGNSAQSNYAFGFPAIPNANIDASTSRGQLAFAGDLGVAASYSLTDHIALRAGYQLLWIDGVALASDQFNVSVPPNSNGPVINSTSGVFYHGALLGLEASW